MLKYSLKQLQYFIVAGQTCSVTKAAEIMCVSQPSISAAVAHLENVFGIQLFIRHHAKGLTLTGNGKKIFTQAKALLEQAEELQNTAIDINSGVSGIVNIACFVTLAPVIAPSLIRDFQQRYSSVQVNCYEGDHDTIFDGLASGKFDLALTYRLDIPQFLIFETLAYYEPYVIVNKNHRLARKRSITLEQLKDEPMVLLDLPHSRQYFETIFRDAGFNPNISHRAMSPHLVRSMVSNGFGYSVMNIPVGSKNSLDGKEFVKIKLLDKLQPTIMGIVKLADYKFTKTMSLFYEHCKEILMQ